MTAGRSYAYPTIHAAKLAAAMYGEGIEYPVRVVALPGGLYQFYDARESDTPEGEVVATKTEEGWE